MHYSCDETNSSASRKSFSESIPLQYSRDAIAEICPDIASSGKVWVSWSPMAGNKFMMALLKT